MPITPVTLEADQTRLEPLSDDHADGLAQLALDSDLWRWTPTQIHTRDDLTTYIDAANRELTAGTALPFAIVERATGRAIGSTRLGNIDLANARVEIGWTWLGRPFQRRAFNTESKLLLLTHAFETLDCVRVELRADSLNAKSRAAIERLGAVEEGTLRQHMILPTGRRVDWVYYGILRDEWPGVRDRLRALLAAYA